MNLLDLYVRVAVDDAASGQMEGLSSTMIAKGQLIASAVQSAVTTAFNAIKGLVGGAVSAFGEYEQLVGGVETLYKGAAGTIVSNAQNAFRTAGMSANQYMQTVNTFAATLVNSVARRNAGIVSSTGDAMKQSVSNFKSSADDAYNAASQRMSDVLDAQRQANQDALEATRDAFTEEERELQKSQRREVESFREVTDAKVDEINQRYEAQLEAVEKEVRLQTGSIDEQIKAIDEQKAAREKASRERERAEKLSALREAKDHAGTMDEKAEAEKDYADYVRKIRDEDARSALDERRKQLVEERSQIREAASERKTQLREQQQEEVEQYKAAREQELKALQESQTEQLEEMRKHHEQALREQQRASEAQLKAMQRANQDALAEMKRSAAQQSAAMAGTSGQFVDATEKDYEQAAKLADLAARDMSDNANKMGTEMARIQDAYQGFSRDNFTMLDNLKLGFGGSKTEMERLLETAEQIQGKYGEVRDYSVDSFADIVEAIHVVQVEMGVSGVSMDELREKLENNDFTLQELGKLREAWGMQGATFDEVREKAGQLKDSHEQFTAIMGTTALEGGSTIEGALNRVSAAWDNWLISLTDPDYDVEQSTKDLMESVGNAAGLIVPKVTTIIDTIGKYVEEHGPEIAETLKNSFLSALPEEWKEKAKDYKDTLEDIADAAKDVAEFLGHVKNVVEWFITEAKSIGEIVDNVGQIFTHIPEIVSATLHGGNYEAMSENGKAIVKGFVSGAEYQWDFEGKGFFENIAGWIKAHKGPVDYDRQLLVENGAAIIEGLVTGASGEWSGSSSFFSEMGGVIAGFFDGAGSWLPGSGDETIAGFLDGMSRAWGMVDSFLGGMWRNVTSYFSNAGDWLFAAGQNILNGFLDGLVASWDGVTEFIGGIGQWIVDNKGPEQYDKNLLVPAGGWIMQGFEKGLRKGFPLIEGAVADIGDLLTVDASMGVRTAGLATSQVRGLPPVNVYMTYNAGDDARGMIGDMVEALESYGYARGGESYA